MALIALTLYENSTNPSATVASANQLFANVTGSTATANITNVLGTATGWSELFSQGTSNAWQGLGSAGAPSGGGWFFDATTLDGQAIAAGNWQSVTSLKVSAGSPTVTILTRYWRYQGGVYTLLGSITLAGNNVTTTVAAFTSALTALPQMTFPAGSNLYVDKWINVTAAGSVGSTIAVKQCTVAAGGGITCEEITPGYAAYRNKDVASRFKLGSNALLKNVAMRIRMVSQKVLKDVRTRLKLQVSDNPYGYTVYVSRPTNIGWLPQIIADMKAQGSTILRCQTPWYLIDTVQDGTMDITTYHWTELDTTVALCNAAGINVHLSVLYPPTGTAGVRSDTIEPINAPTGYFTYGVSAASCGGAGITRYLPDPTMMAVFCLQLAQRYNGGSHGFIYAIEPGNEEYDLQAHNDYPCVRDAGGYPAGQACTIINTGVTYNAIHYPAIGAILSNCLIVAPATMRQDLTGTGVWMAGFASAGGLINCDVVTIHWYKNGGTWPVGNTPENGTGLTVYYQSVLANMQAAGTVKPIWLTECGYDLDLVSTPGDSQTDAAHQATYLTQLCEICRLSQGVITKIEYYTVGNNLSKSLTAHGIAVDGLTETYTTAWTAYSTEIATYPQWSTGSKDIRSRFRIRSASALRDLRMRFRLISTPAFVPGSNSGYSLDLSIYKAQMVMVYDPTGAFLDCWRDAPLLAGFKEAISDGTSILKVQLPRSFDNFDQVGAPNSRGTVAQGNIVQYWLFGPGLPLTGLMRFQGAIDTYEPQIADSGEESVLVNITPYSSILGDRGVTGFAGKAFGTPASAGTYVDPLVMAKYWFITTDPNTGQVYTWEPGGKTVTWDAGNPTSSGITVQYTFVNQTLTQMFQTILQMLPVNWFHRFNMTTNTWTFNVSPGTAQHTLYVGQHMSNPQYMQDWSVLNNVVYMLGGPPAGSPTGTAPLESIKVGSDIATFGERIIFASESRAIDANTVSVLAQGILAINDHVAVRGKIRVPDYRGSETSLAGYDIETLKVGDTIQIIDPSAPVASLATGASWDQSRWDVDAWDGSAGFALSQVVQIVTLSYYFDYVDVGLGFLQPSQDKQLTQIRQDFQDFTMI